MSKINNSCVKLSCLVGEAISEGYEGEATFIASYFFKKLVDTSYPNFYVVDCCKEDITQRNDSLYYLDFLSCDITEEFNICCDCFISVNLMFEVLSNHYNSKELSTVELNKVSELYEVTNKISWRDIKHFDKVTTILKTVVVDYLQQLEVGELNKVLKSHFEVFNNTTLNKEFIYSIDNSYLVCTSEDFKEYTLLNTEELKSYVEDIVFSFEFEDLEVLIDCIL